MHEIGAKASFENIGICIPICTASYFRRRKYPLSPVGRYQGWKFAHSQGSRWNKWSGSRLDRFVLWESIETVC